jgi:hypothetical protein
MGMFLVFGVEGADTPVDDATGWTASNTGWSHFSGWAAGLPPGEYPELVYLGEYGDCFAEDGSASAVEALEAELERALAERPDDPPEEVLGVGKQLLQALRRRPESALAAVVTDGTGLDEDEEDEGEGDDLDNDNGDGGPPGEGDEEQYRSLEEAEAKGLGCTCGPACGCTGCKALEANEEECRKLQEQLLALDQPVDFLISLLRTREAARGMGKALSALGEAGGGALVAPAGQGGQDQVTEEQLRQKLEELTTRREAIRERLCSLCGICPTGEGDHG